MYQSTSYQAWAQEEHVDHFSLWDRSSASRLVKQCYGFNEFQLFRTLIGNSTCSTISDIGCATGGFFRFFQKVWPALTYKGFDISEVAIEHARQIHPAGNFQVFDGHPKSPEQAASDIVFCRDVVHHQTSPDKFLSELYDIAGSYLLLRVRTREVGATVFDVEQSCQYTYGNWVPYIVFNTSELVDLISSFQPAPTSLTIRRHPVVLGGQVSRFLPKELYYPETGTAETAVLIDKRADGANPTPLVINEAWPETNERPRIYQLLRRLARRWGL
ncbi:MAG: class I SAM-dependent methyltransferase [Dehalococcoidia bacterium]